MFSVALPSDGALTWDVPPPVEEDGIVVPGTDGPKPVNFNDALDGFRCVSRSWFAVAKCCSVTFPH